MKKDEDFRMQQLLDGKMQGEERTAPENMDAKDLQAYEVLYGHLKEKPGQGLPLSFKSDVLREIEMERKRASDTKFYLLLAVVAVIGIIVIASLFFVFKDAIAPSLSILNKFKGFIVIGIVAVFAFGLTEKKLGKL